VRGNESSVGIRRKGLATAVRIGVSVGVLVLLGLALDSGVIVRQLRGADPTWIVAALLLSVLQVGVSAWRWRFTAARIGLRLPFAEALCEYYLSSFLNQLLPGGVLGDVSRAWRQSWTTDSRESAVRAVILERASGQVVMLAVAGACAAALAIQGLGSGEALVGTMQSGFVDRLGVAAPSEAAERGAAGVREGLGGGLWGVVVGGIVLLGLIAEWVRRKVRRGPSDASAGDGPLWSGWTALRGLWHRSWSETHKALLAPRALGPQLLSSLFVVGSYIWIFVFAARAVGAEASTPTLLLLVPPVLVAMLTPVSVAGWGLREGAAALLWSAVGLSATEGIAASVMYGLLVLASTLPGAAILVWLLLTREGLSVDSVSS